MDLSFDGIQRGDPFQRFGSNRQSMRHMQVKEFAPDMRPAGCLLNATGVVQPVATGVRFFLQRAPELGEMPVWMLSSAFDESENIQVKNMRLNGQPD